MTSTVARKLFVCYIGQQMFFLLDIIRPSLTTMTIGKISSFILYMNTLWLGPSISPTESPTETPTMQCTSWCIAAIIVAVLLILALSWIMLELCWKIRCCNLECWDSPFWTNVFCDCLRKSIVHLFISICPPVLCTQGNQQRG